MDQLIPALAGWIEAWRPWFHPQVLRTFHALCAGWLVCLEPRTVSAVWQATGWAGRRHHDTAYAVFRTAAWQWDTLGLWLAELILTHLVPAGVVTVVVDDTLCHKRGAAVAFGGIYLDPVLSSRRRKVFRFGLNWVVLGLVVPMPRRSDRTICLPVLWWLCRKPGQAGYQTRPQAAAALLRRLATAQPQRSFRLVGDSAYINAAVLRHRPANVAVVGPIHWKAALYAPPPPRQPGQRGATRKKGDRLPHPRALLADTAADPATTLKLSLGRQSRWVRVQVVRDVLWYRGSHTEPITVVLVRDPQGQWRDEALLSTDATLTAAAVITSYCGRWSVEMAFHDSKQFLGLQDPQVWNARSVERAHPMAWFLSSVTVVWYSLDGYRGPQVHRDRPWYRHKVSPTFSDMLGALRLQMWQTKLYGVSGQDVPSRELLDRLLHRIAAVA